MTEKGEKNCVFDINCPLHTQVNYEPIRILCGKSYVNDRCNDL